MDKMCPFINRFNVSIKYGGSQYESNATGFEWLECQEEKCMAWGVVKSIECRKYEGVEYNERLRCCV